jgi:outer membrane protein assembly factor BamB
VNKITLCVVGILGLFILSALAPIGLGLDVKTTTRESKIIDDLYYLCRTPDGFNEEKYEYYKEQLMKQDTVEDSETTYEEILAPSTPNVKTQFSGPMDSAWPMYCYDARHIGRSPYSTGDNPGFEKWFYKTGSYIEGSGAIDKDGIIYFGSWDNDFRALYPNGTLKWKHDIGGNVEDTGPAIDVNGIIYVGTKTTVGNRMFAFYPNGTVKWSYKTDEWIYGSPVIGDDGCIYFAGADGWPWYGHVYALYLNGTLKWKYKTNDVIYSDPAIGLDGTVYCGCHDGNLYALYPNNGTLKWKYKTGDWVARGPCIADDGTVIFGSWDRHLYACYPNGTLRWKTSVSVVTTPVIGPDGTIYVGSDSLSAIDPEDGSIKWSYDVPDRISGGNPVVSADGIIYCVSMKPGHIVAVNPDGTLRWKKYIGYSCLFAPIIGKDGTIYTGTSDQQFTGTGYILTGYLHAFNEIDIDAPSEPVIIGPGEGEYDVKYEFRFSASSPLGNDLFYFVDWGDWSNSGWIGPYKSGDLVFINHSFEDGPQSDNMVVRVKARDGNNLWSPWGYHDFNIPRNRATHSSVCLRFVDMFPILERILEL